MKTRKINRAKRVSSGCRNNGSCPHCRSSRTHSNKRRAPIRNEDVNVEKSSFPLKYDPNKVKLTISNALGEILYEVDGYSEYPLSPPVEEHKRAVRVKYPAAFVHPWIGGRDDETYRYEIISLENIDTEDDERDCGPSGATETIAWAEAYLYVLRGEEF